MDAAERHGLMLDGSKKEQLLIELCFDDALVLNALTRFISEACKNLKVGIQNPWLQRLRIPESRSDAASQLTTKTTAEGIQRSQK